MRFATPQSGNGFGNPGPNTFSLALLFQAVTACGLFFALFQFWPVTAILLTAVLTPCIIRTILCVRASQPQPGIGLADRVRFFLSSLLIVVVTVFTSMVTVAIICTLFGMTAIAFEMSIDGQFRFSPDVFFLGATGGVIFGMGGGLVAATALVSRIWTWGMPVQTLQAFRVE